MGIPEIRLHPTDLDREEVAEQAKGWLLFLGYGTSQPRALGVNPTGQQVPLSGLWISGPVGPHHRAECARISGAGGQGREVEFELDDLLVINP
ncbi:hypothetical protein CA14_003023 [Aspergillus flavus]|uniref:Uncharacterized protein n=1 Tax=Aspergillus flavus TaxID=5059 RepID=A0AB74C7J8_ASPFL|nr:hypothetical protein CA14_003023 [Aspergillus flavus]